MKIERFISNKERKLILLIAFAAFVFSIAGSISYSVEANAKRAQFYKEQEENEANLGYSFSGPYCIPDRHPQLLFSISLFVGTTFLALCFAKKYLLSFALTIASLSRFINWHIDTRSSLTDDISDLVNGVDRVFYKAGIFDIAVLSLLSILFFWQILILLRMLIKTLQRKDRLP